MAEATKVPSKNTLTLRKEYGYPNGHLGHLTEPQETALVKFKELSAKESLYTPAKDGKPASHDESVML